MQSTTTIPRDDRKEKEVLGELIQMSKERIREVRDTLDEDLFYSTYHKEVYKSICRLNDSGYEADLSYIIMDMKEHDIDVDVARLAEMPTLPLTTAYIARDIEILDNYKKARMLWIIGQELVQKGQKVSGDMNALIENTLMQLSKINTGKALTATLTDALDNIEEIIQENREGKPRYVSTPIGFKWLDAKGGFQSGSLIVVAGATSMGKTSFVNTISYNAIRKGHKVGYFSMEMPKEKLASRLLSMETNVYSNTIMTQPLTDWQKGMVDKGIDKLRMYSDNMFFADSTCQSINEVIANIRYMHTKFGIHGAIVDYLQMLEGRQDKQSNEQFIASCARRLKNLALQLGIWICILSQLNKDKDRPEPTLDRLRDSGQIADAADIVMLVYRPEYYDKEGQNLTYRGQWADVTTKGTAEIKVEKGRDIGTGSFITKFVESTTAFYDYEDGETPEVNQAKVTQVYDENLPF